MAVKKQTYVSAELEWAESKLQEWRAYIDKNPIAELKDRIEWKPTAIFEIENVAFCEFACPFNVTFVELNVQA